MADQKYRDESYLGDPEDDTKETEIQDLGFIVEDRDDRRIRTVDGLWDRLDNLDTDEALEVNPNVLHRWRREFRQGPANVFPGNGKQRWSEGRIAELERKIGQQSLEIDFLKGCLQRIEEQRMLQALTGSPRSTGRSKKK